MPHFQKPSMPRCSVLILFVCTAAVAAQPTCPPVEERDAEVLVFGAGATGITVARALYDNGLTNVLVLEAADRIGGRVRNVEFEGVQVELGANWITVQLAAPENNPIWTIARSTNVCPMIFTSSNPLETVLSNYDNYQAFDENGNIATRAYTMARDAVYEALLSAKSYSMQLQSSGDDDITVRAALENFGWNPSTPIEDVAEWFNFDFYIAETPDVTSLFVLFPDVNNYEFNEENDYFVTDQRGFSSVVDCIAEGFPEGNIRLEHTINSISHSDDCVCASVTSDGTERTMCGTYGVATFSVGVLQDFARRSLFDPQLSTSKQDFINSIRMGYYLKIFVSFPETFWNTSVEYIYRSDDKQGRYALIQPLNLLPGNPNMIVVTATEDEAVRISSQDVNTTKLEIMEVLRGIYGDDIPEIDNILVPTWINDPLYLGMFSSAPYLLTLEDHIRFSEPEGNLFLSGEANLVGENGYVHSAYCSGMETSGAILRATGRSTDRGNLPTCPLVDTAP